MKRLVFAMMMTASMMTQTALAAEVGVRTVRVGAAHRGGTIETFVWYPAEGGGVIESVGDNPLFVGVAALRDAAVAGGRHPVVILSHGSGGNAANLSWFAGVLAQEGFIVAAPNHPGTTSRDSRPADTVKFWERPADLSAVADYLLTSDEWKGKTDPKHLTVSGFSLGGFAALASAGAMVNAKAYARYCDTNKETLSECAWLAKGGVDLHKLDETRVNQSNLDARFTAVMPIDPGLAQAYTAESLAAIGIPTLIINFGAPGKIPLAVDSAKLVKIIPGAEYRTIADAIHFSFLGNCRPNGKQILAAEGEPDPLCDDGGGRARTAIHDEIIALAVSFLKAHSTQ